MISFSQVGNKIPSKQVIMTQAPATVISSEPENQLASEAQESGSEEKESSEMEVDEDANEDQEDEETEKHVGFEVEEEEDASARPNRLHRRDTPHHLKDRRINVNLDHSKVASIIAQVRLELSIMSVMHSEIMSCNKTKKIICSGV